VDVRGHREDDCVVGDLGTQMGRASCRKLRLTASTGAMPFLYRVDGRMCGTPVAASPSVAITATCRSGLTVPARLRGLSYDPVQYDDDHRS
jgi:hypothetical protein